MHLLDIPCFKIWYSWYYLPSSEGEPNMFYTSSYRLNKWVGKITFVHSPQIGRQKTIKFCIMGLHLWCDLEKSVGTRTCDIFSFQLDWSAHWRGTFCWKPHLNWSSGYFLAISHNQCFRLIPLDRNTKDHYITQQVQHVPAPIPWNIEYLQHRSWFHINEHRQWNIQQVWPLSLCLLFFYLISPQIDNLIAESLLMK